MIQFFNSSILLVGFASVMGMVILFFELENPETNLDRKTGLFNRYAFDDFMEQRYREEKDCCVIELLLKDRQSKEMKADQLESAIYEVSRFLRGASEGKIFKTDDREFVLESICSLIIWLCLLRRLPKMWMN